MDESLIRGFIEVVIRTAGLKNEAAEMVTGSRANSWSEGHDLYPDSHMIVESRSAADKVGKWKEEQRCGFQGVVCGSGS